MEFEERKIKKKKDWNKYFVVMTIITIIFIVAGAMIGFVNYNYKLEKCSSMNSSTSDYNFTHRVELDADFNENCFYYQNHPLAFVGELVGNIMLFLIISFIFWMIGWAYIMERHIYL